MYSNDDYQIKEWSNPLEKLRGKWSEVPAGDGRVRTTDLHNYSDGELMDFWNLTRMNDTTGNSFNVRGWYHCLYNTAFRHKKLMDVGSGLGIDGITFAQCGSEVTFVDIVESNLELLRRICALFKLENVKFHYLKDFDTLGSLSYDYDVIWCQGSMINLPYKIAAEESKSLLEHLPIGGRWIELAYPKERWVAEGKLPFEKWGSKTDGGAPWIEWVPRASSLLEPSLQQV